MSMDWLPVVIWLEAPREKLGTGTEAGISARGWVFGLGLRGAAEVANGV